MVFNITIGAEEIKKIIAQKKDGNAYFNIGQINLDGIINTGTPVCTFFDMKVTGNYNGFTGSSEIISINTGSTVAGDKKVKPSFSVSGTDLIIDNKAMFDEFVSSFDMQFFNGNVFTGLNVYYAIECTGSFNAPYDIPSNATITDSKFVLAPKSSIETISIGCNGENVQAGNQFETVPETIKYLLTDYMGVDVADIDTTSFTNAESEFDNFPSSSVRNAARQIVGQSNANEVLKSLLYNYNLGLFISRNGKYTLNNWLWKSYILDQGNSAYASLALTDSNFSAISKITRDNITALTSDYELKYNYSEAEDTFLNAMRITGSENSTFDFDTCTEGVNRSDYALAESAWNNCRAAYKRLRKSSQTTVESKWIKPLYADGSNTVEAINFIRTITAHTSREHEYVTITVPYNFVSLGLELLSFISVQDTLVTNSKPRLGWLVERKINVDKNTIDWKLLLDVSQDDPFITPINIIRDVSSLSVDVIQDDDTAIDIIQDGTGI